MGADHEMGDPYFEGELKPEGNGGPAHSDTAWYASAKLPYFITQDRVTRLEDVVSEIHNLVVKLMGRDVSPAAAAPHSR
eukprot:12926616-Prorocentrum_lima.AAC.1